MMLMIRHDRQQQQQQLPVGKHKHVRGLDILVHKLTPAQRPPESESISRDILLVEALVVSLSAARQRIFQLLCCKTHAMRRTK